MEFALSHSDGPRRPAGKGGKEGGREPPGWAEGLKRHYDKTVAEPLPQSFLDLLKKLDQGGSDAE